ncbi:MSO1 [Candida pseudojiufengensis]|uniref:MSO1 n=1 Tax=Candida pseudojiufengensis TaxID=497109 RepID=UPI002224F971|nr:MSO1 [Candida pseudojiufengensis]KAI5963337.1 MSO1 [Candida pseudojiufengensis]
MQHSNTGGGFFSKIKENYSTKLANLSLSNYSEKDGSSEDDTLIHNAFVKYYESKGLPYPEWLGVKIIDHQQQPNYGSRSSSYNNNSSNNGQSHAYRNHSSNNISQFHPVRQDNVFNNSYSQRTYNQQQQQQQQPTVGSSSQQHPTYQRSSSKLQDMYNKSRQQSQTSSNYGGRYSR